MDLKGLSTLSVNAKVCICVCIKFQHYVYVDVDIDAENEYRTHSLHLHFVTIASIIFENANTDINTRCEWALISLCEVL